MIIRWNDENKEYDNDEMNDEYEWRWMISMIKMKWWKMNIDDNDDKDDEWRW